MAFVVIVHLDRTHESRMPELIQSHTSMPVLQVTEPVLVQRNHTYVIPPDRDLSMEDGHLIVGPRAASPGIHAPIDTFFRTLAETHTVDAVAVVLSGMGSDGAQGLKAVRDRGGITMAQIPGDADFDSMPQSAIATGQVDLVLDAEALGAKLSQLNRTGRLELTDDGDSTASGEKSAQRAVTEELETSKEELQSINAELRTLNQEHRTRNEELAQVNADLLNLIDSTSIGTLFLDRQLCIRRYTPTIAQLFNVVPADRGRPLADLAHRLEYAGLLHDARAVLSTLIPAEREIGSTDKRWFTMRITPYRSVGDRIDGVVLTFTDTTERRRGEMEHEELLKTVAEISETKSNFIGVMSHEFRTPLNAILGYADILDVGAAGPVTAVQRAHFDRIKSNARHLNLMVDQILSSSRLERQRPIPTPEPFDAAALAREVAAGIEPLVQTKQLSLNVEIPETPIIVESDPTMVRQILFNLLGNAVRFTDTGSITLRLPPRDEMLVLEVEDSGIGIAPENVGLVFERFWQADQSSDRRRGGNGLGLMVSRSLAEALGGTINLESALGRGSLFRLSVPARKTADSSVGL